jgi:hypothetical protein
MDGLELETGTTPVRTTPVRMTPARRVLRALRAHIFLTVIMLGVLVGGGLRFLPTDVAAATGPDAEVAASTACAAP